MAATPEQAEALHGRGKYARSPMIRRVWRLLWLLMGCALVACATAPIPEGERADAGDEGAAVSFEEACEDESSLLALCDESQCGLYRCQEVMEYLAVGRVVLARGGAVGVPSPQAGAQTLLGECAGVAAGHAPGVHHPMEA